MSNTATETWRDVIRSTGESLARDAFDPRADARTLLARTAAALLLVEDEVERAEQVEQRRNT